MSTTELRSDPELSSSFAQRFPALGTEWEANDAPEPTEVVINDDLAELLGIDVEWLHSPEGVAFLVGTNVPEGAMPIAMAYAGHQFGGYSPLLGDGRALLLGEVTKANGTVADLHLKGSGRTPYSRGGDGLATLAAMLREYLMAEAMHALSVPTSRALGVVTTVQAFSVSRWNVARSWLVSPPATFVWARSSTQPARKATLSVTWSTTRSNVTTQS